MDLPLDHYDYSGELYMLADDVRLFVLPYDQDETGLERYRFSITASEEESFRLAVLFGETSARDLDRALSKFVRTAAFLLAHEGRVQYEVRRTVADEDSGPPLYRLDPMRKRGAVRLLGRVLFWLPQSQRGGRMPVQVVDEDAVWELRLPAELGGRAGHRRLARTLRQTTNLTPDFALDDLARAGKEGFEFEAHARLRDIAIASVTERWGWTARWSWRDRTTEYFGIQRDLLFKLRMAQIREHLAIVLNSLLLSLGVEASIELIQPSASREIARARRELARGDIDFAAAVALASGSQASEPAV